MAARSVVDFPSEISEKFAEFRECLKNIEAVLEPTLTTSVSETREKFEPLDRAKLDLVTAYALNSLFFMYLRTKGEDVQEHDIKKELERIRGYMARVKDTVDRLKAARVDVPAVKRFVRNALWTPQETDVDQTTESNKRKATDDVQIEVRIEGAPSKAMKTETPKEKRNKSRK